MTVQQAILEKGFAKVEWWIGKDRAAVNTGNVGTPDYTYATPAFEACGQRCQRRQLRQSDQRVRYPRNSGAYDFFVNSDDDCDLRLSTMTSRPTND